MRRQPPGQFRVRLQPSLSATPTSKTKLRCLPASSSAYSANPKSKLSSPPPLTGSAISVLSFVQSPHFRFSVRPIILTVSDSHGLRLSVTGTTNWLGFRMFGRSEDKISNLSDALLTYILSFLDMKDAIQSSVLSKRWRNLWTFIPNLIFEGQDFENRKSFKKFVTQVLLRRSKSDVVQVSYEDDSYAITLLAESVVHYAVRHGVQELYLSMSDDDSEELFVLPRCLFGCQTLRKLELVDSSHKIRVPSYLGLNALKHLSLSGFSLSEEYLDWRALSSCPNLETLILNYHCLPNVGTFHIYALNLRRFELVCESDIELETGFMFIISAPRLITFDLFSPSPIVCSMDCPSLEQAIIYVHPDSKIEESLCVYSIKLLNECRNAKSITISLDTLKVLSAFPALLEEHRSTFGQLGCLTLRCEEDSGFELPPCILTYFLNGSSSVTLRVCS